MSDRGPVDAAGEALGAGERGEPVTGVLRREHERILEVVEAFETAIERAESGRLDDDTIADFLAFFRLYVGGCHHGKEEEVLFPALEAGGTSGRTGPLALMREEHRRGHALVATMSRALARARRGDAAAAERLREAALDYVELLRGHIGKENPAVFDLADRTLDRPACRRLCEAYRAADARGVDGRSIDDLRRMADDLLARGRRGPPRRA